MDIDSTLKTQLYDAHIALGARILPFGGWDMPIQYEGILAETAAIRTNVGMFDVSHMGRVYISGDQAEQFLEMLLTAPVSTMKINRARYALICNPNGGIIDDTIFYKLSATNFLLIPNAGNRIPVVAWFNSINDQHFEGSITINDTTLETSMIAIQGPNATAIFDNLCVLTDGTKPSSLKYFCCSEGSINSSKILIGRTGYTGEDGFEIMIDKEDSDFIWNLLLKSGVTPCGLGARDVLRLEAALPLYGHELNSNVTPVDAGLTRFLKKSPTHIGSSIIQQQLNNGTDKTLIGLTIPGKSAPRPGYKIYQNDQEIGEVTSGSYSPSLNVSIALAYVSTVQYKENTEIILDIRGKLHLATKVQIPFYKRGKK
jgi:aminomethyltransferase